MFGIGSTELVVILIVALIVLGPSKLPEIARSLGKALGEFRRVTTDVKRTIEMEAEQAEQQTRTEEAKKEFYPEDKANAADAAPAEAKAEPSVKTEAQQQTPEQTKA